MTASDETPLTFEFSLTVLNHLGRQLYRNFITVIGEAISNSWDADATHVSIELDQNGGCMTILDNGNGMTRDDLQNKFLKIGYSKRSDGDTTTIVRDRPFIGAKGIGKLALLSCAKEVTVISKTKDTQPTGCILDNTEIDTAIKEDKTNQQVPLPSPPPSQESILADQDQGTALIFRDMKMANSTDTFLRKSLALFFRFTLIDDNFEITYNGSKITVEDAKELADKTQYVWRIGEFEDPYLVSVNAPLNRTQTIEPPDNLPGLKGFLATVVKPSDLNVFGASARAGVDLFVNGRLRERDILKHRPSARVPAQYLYGQIHLDSLDDGTDEPFTSNRESVVEDNQLFTTLLDYLDDLTRHKIFDQWDEWRLADKQTGDEDNKRLSKKERKSREYIGEQAKEVFKDTDYEEPTSAYEELVAKAVRELESSIDDYTLLYFLENVMRLIAERYEMVPSNRVSLKAEQWRTQAQRDFSESSLAQRCRTNESELWYLGIADLMQTLECCRANQHRSMTLDSSRSSVRYLRNIVMHTATLTSYGQDKLGAYGAQISGILQSITADEEEYRRNTEPVVTTTE